MQLYADILGRELIVSRTAQAPALGSAINAASAAGIENAIDAMSDGNFKIYFPNEDNIARYDALYSEYLALHDYFGRGGNRIMERLRGKE
jgi:L-ribulokinase